MKRRQLRDLGYHLGLRRRLDPDDVALIVSILCGSFVIALVFVAYTHSRILFSSS